MIESGDSTPDKETFSAYAYGHPNAKALTLLIDPEHGVSMDRPSVATVRVGLKGRNPTTKAPPRFTHWQMTKAIYDTGWDGDVAIRASADGKLSLESGF